MAPRTERREDAGSDDEILRRAWRSLPSTHRQLLESIGASQCQVVNQKLGQAAHERRLSAGLTGLSTSVRNRLDRALAVWLQDLRIMLVDGSHEKLVGLNVRAREQFIAHLAWHEWGHALSVTSALRRT